MTFPYYPGTSAVVYNGDCLDILKTLPDASVDAVVTDPPYGLSREPDMAEVMRHWLNGDDYSHTGNGFMGKSWDSFVPGPSVWRECFRVLKPGGHLLSFAGSRTQDLMGLAIRLAGFEIRDSIAWLYGSGFPKSLDVSKAIDKQRTEDRAPVDAVRAWLNARRIEAGLSHDAVNKHFGHASNGGGSSSAWMTNPTGRSLPTWEQWLALKALFGFGDGMDAEVWRLNGRKGTPGEAWQTADVLATDIRYNEPSGVVNIGQGERALVERQIKAANSDAAQQWQGWGTALKPAFEPIVVGRKPFPGTVASNVLEHGTGAINIEGCRIGDEIIEAGRNGRGAHVTGSMAGGELKATVVTGTSVGRWPTNVVLDESQAAELDKQTGITRSSVRQPTGRDTRGIPNGSIPVTRFHDTTERGVSDQGGASRFFPVFKYQAKAPAKERPKDADGKGHATVKPLELMRWLVRLVTPSSGVVLEPFAGSGTTVEAAILEGFYCVAIERESEYLPLIFERIRRSTPSLNVSEDETTA